MASHDTQDGPIQDGSGEADDTAKLTGLLTQVRADYLLGSSVDAATLLRQRIDDAGITVDDDAFARLVERVTA